jgi:hypothetical protein
LNELPARGALGSVLDGVAGDGSSLIQLLIVWCSCLQKDAEAAAAGGLFGRLRGNMAIPSSWTSVLGQVGS